MSKAKKYRKKPVIVEAFLYEGHIPKDAPKWVLDACKRGDIHEGFLGLDRWLSVHTLEGNAIARRGTYIVRGVKGELYPVRADIFEQTYEEVEE